MAKELPTLDIPVPKCIRCKKPADFPREYCAACWEKWGKRRYEIQKAIEKKTDPKV